MYSNVNENCLYVCFFFVYSEPSTTMSTKNKAEMDPAVMINSITTLTHQLELCSNQPSVQIAKALLATQAEVATLKATITDLHQTVIAIR